MRHADADRLLPEAASYLPDCAARILEEPQAEMSRKA